MDENGSFGKGQREREPKRRGTTNEASAPTARQSDTRVLSLVSFQNADLHMSYHHLFCRRVCFCKKYEQRKEARLIYIVLPISKIQLVVYYQCRALIG